jgi:epoxyqueuosine reductase
MDPAGHDDTDRPPPAASPLGRIARYAWGDDYHELIKKRLYAMADTMRRHWPDHQFRAAVDTAPLLEREHAQRAGLGWIGKHTLLIHQDLGSWMLLGQIVTTLPVEPDPHHPPVTDHCGTCTRCIDACPTDCIRPYQLDASRCISYLTIEHRGLIEPALQPMMGDWVAGCDVCQQVCPFNDRAAGLGPGQAARSDDVLTEAIHPKYQPRPPAPAMNLLEILGWDAEARQKTFTKSALKRIKLDQFKRNALIAAGNYLADHEDQQLRRRVEELADEDESPLLRQTAQQVLDRLNALGP